MDMAHQLGFCLPQSPQGRLRAHSKPIEKPVVQPVEEQKLEDPQVSEELGMKVIVTGGRRGGEILISLPGWRSELAITPGCGRTQALGLPASCLVTMTHSLPKLPPSEQKLDLQPEPTVKFLFTLLSAVELPEPKEPEE